MDFAAWAATQRLSLRQSVCARLSNGQYVKSTALFDCGNVEYSSQAVHPHGVSLNRAATCSEQIEGAAEFCKPHRHLRSLQPKQTSRPLRKT